MPRQASTEPVAPCEQTLLLPFPLTLALSVSRVQVGYVPAFSAERTRARRESGSGRSGARTPRVTSLPTSPHARTPTTRSDAERQVRAGGACQAVDVCACGPVGRQ